MSDNTTPHQAADYDRAVRQTIPFYEAIQQQAIDLVRTVKPDPACWLDTGCGTGYLVAQALPLFPRTRFVLADPSEAMLEQARARFAGVPPERVTLLPPKPTAGLLAYRNEIAPQVITAILCHHYLQADQRAEAARVCYEMLESGGVFITFENVEPRTPEGTRVGLERWGRYQRDQGRSPETVEGHLRRFKTEYFPIPVVEHVALLEAVGFRAVELLWFTYMQAGLYAFK